MRTYTLQNERMSVVVSTLGAELQSVVVDGKERLWQNETGEWASHAPILFPYCGNCALRFNGERLSEKRHGFCRDKEFELHGKNMQEVTLQLVSDKETRKIYPYDFKFRVTYLISGTKLTVRYEIENTGFETLFYACGGHESFALDAPLSEYELTFPHRELFETLVHDNDGLLTGEKITLPHDGVSLPLPTDYLTDGRTVIFGNIRSASAILKKKTGEKVAALTFREFRNLLLWHPGNSQMICIEPWTNLPDRVGDTTEFERKRGIATVVPGSVGKMERSIEYFNS